MSGTSNVGGRGVYEAGDQRTYKDSEINQAKAEQRYHEGKDNSHLANDSSKQSLPCKPVLLDPTLLIKCTEDERSIANKLAREEKVPKLECCECAVQMLTVSKRQNEPDPISKEAAESQKDPTLPVSALLA